MTGTAGSYRYMYSSQKHPPGSVAVLPRPLYERLQLLPLSLLELLLVGAPLTGIYKGFGGLSGRHEGVRPDMRVPAVGER